MATKTRDEVQAILNGNGQVSATSHRLTPFQEKYMRRLIANFERARAAVEQAQNAANDFIVACSEEQGIQIGAGGWTFDIDALEFMRIPQPAQDGVHQEE